MDSILSSVLSIFSHNPIFVLGIIAYIAFSIIKSKNTEESDEYDNYESSSSGQTWEDMEREYGISIEKKPVEPSPEDLLYDDDFYREIFKNRPIENQHPEAPLRKKGDGLFQYDTDTDPKPSQQPVEEHQNNDKAQTVLASEHHYDEASTTQQGTHVSSKKTSSKSTGLTTSTTRLSRESVTGPTLSERLSEFKRDKASKEGKVLLDTNVVTTSPITSTSVHTSSHKRISNHALKEGMKWSIILSKPKALERRYR